MSLLSCLPVLARVAGQDFSTNSTSLVDVTGLSVALNANTTYYFKASLSVNSSSSAGLAVGLAFSAAGAAVEARIVGTTSAATAVNAARYTSLGASSATLATNGADGVVEISGIITTGANAGNLTVQLKKLTSGTAKVYQNSLLYVVESG